MLSGNLALWIFNACIWAWALLFAGQWVKLLAVVLLVMDIAMMIRLMGVMAAKRRAPDANVGRHGGGIAES